jgi:large subunit ribosomal protein L29
LKASDIRELSDEEVVRQLTDARQEVFNLRFQHATGALENSAGLAGARRDVARLLTIARERGLGEVT